MIAYDSDDSVVAVLGLGDVCISVSEAYAKTLGKAYLIKFSGLSEPLYPGCAVSKEHGLIEWIKLAILNLEGLSVLEGACAAVRSSLERDNRIFSQVGFDEWESEEEATP